MHNHNITTSWKNFALYILHTCFVINYESNYFQITPALLQYLSSDVLKYLFGPNSQTKNLLVGGDLFPTNLIRNYLTPDCPMRIFNVYGVCYL